MCVYKARCIPRKILPENSKGELLRYIMEGYRGRKAKQIKRQFTRNIIQD